MLLTGTIVNAQQPWVTQKVDNRVSIKFPSTPVGSAASSFVTTAPDSSVACVFTVVDFAEVANLDSAALAPVKATPEFAAELKTGFKQKLSDVNFSDLVIGNYKGFTSYSTFGFDSKKKRYDIFMFIIGTNFYTLSVVTAYGGLLETRDKFFDSVEITQ